MELPVFFCVALVLLHIVVNLLDNLCPSFFFPSDEYQLQSADAMMFHSGGEHQWLSSILGLLSRQMSKNIYTHIFHHLESHSLYGNKKNLSKSFISVLVNTDARNKVLLFASSVKTLTMTGLIFQLHHHQIWKVVS